MDKKINTGLIGYGKGARLFHIPFIQALPEFRLKKIVHRSADKTRFQYPVEEVDKEFDSVLKDEAISLVVITTPNHTHYELAKQALLANKHVVVEKPFTVNTSHADELIDLAAERGLVLSVYQNRRWDGDFITMKKLLQGGFLGRLVEFESHYDRFRNYIRQGAWKEQKGEGAGMVYDLSPHLIDQALQLFGRPEMIMADIRTQREAGGADDNFEILLHYPGLKVTLKAGMLVSENNPRFILHGTEGSYIKYGFDPQEADLNHGVSPSSPNWGEESREGWGTLNTRIQGLHFEGKIESIPGSYQGYYQNIANVINGTAELAVKAQEGRNVIRLIELAFQSNEEKRALPVQW